jgi:hypothetical protein
MLLASLIVKTVLTDAHFGHVDILGANMCKLSGEIATYTKQFPRSKNVA